MFQQEGKYIKYITGNITGIFLVACLYMTFASCNKQDNTFLSPSGYDKTHDTAIMMFDNGKREQAVKHLDSAFAKAKGLSFRQIFGHYWLSYNFVYNTKHDDAASMLYADSMLNMFDTPEKKLKYSSEYGQAHFYKGDVLFDQYKYNDAYQYFYRGKLIGSNSLDDCILSDFSYRMGMIMYKQEHYQLAAANFKNASRETISCPLNFSSFYRRQELFNNTGLSYSKISMSDSAMFFFNETLKYINTYGPQFNKAKPQLFDAARGVVYGNQANIYIHQKNYVPAKKLLKKSIEINLRKGNDNRDAQLSELKLAHIYDDQNNNDSLLNTLQVIKLQFDSIKNQDAQADWNYLMSNYYVKKSDNQKAMEFFIHYDALKDTINKKNKTLKEADIAEQIKRLEKDNEFDNLKKNNQLQHIYLMVAAVFAVMLMLIIFLVFLNWQKSQKNIKTLGSLNNQINDQNSHLEFALDELKLNSQEKDRILRTVAHDLRNPIGGIASLTSVMAEEDLSDEQKELLNLIKDTSFNSLELINEILEATNTASAKLNREQVEINSLLSNSVELLRFKAAEKQQTINLDLLGTPQELFISREKIWRVISNLISNAIKFSPNDSEIIVKAEDFEHEVQVSVHDCGIGIPDKLKDLVFHMFTDAKRPGTAGEKSFGLGLSICKQIVEKHGGRIWFDSDPDNGTEFHFSLPKHTGNIDA